MKRNQIIITIKRSSKGTHFRIKDVYGERLYEGKQFFYADVKERIDEIERHLISR